MMSLRRKVAYMWKIRVYMYILMVLVMNVKWAKHPLSLNFRPRTKVRSQFGSNFTSKNGGVWGQYLFFDVKCCDIFGSLQSSSKMAALQSSIEQLWSYFRAQEADIQQLNNKVHRTTELLQSSAVVVNEGRLFRTRSICLRKWSWTSLPSTAMHAALVAKYKTIDTLKWNEDSKLAF